MQIMQIFGIINVGLAKNEKNLDITFNQKNLTCCTNFSELDDFFVLGWSRSVQDCEHNVN